MNSKTSTLHHIRLTIFAVCCLCCFSAFAQQSSDIATKESEYYQIKPVPIPDEVVLEVGGMAFNDKNQLGISTRRGEVWLIDQPASQQPKYSLFASGLHEPLWLSFRNGSFYTTQRSELTKLTDTDQDGVADMYKTIYSWPLSGNYHEYSYGPLFLPDGDMLVTLNLGWVGKGASLAKWRGWMLKISEDGTMVPFATGLRSPAAFGLDAEGDIFYAENQGDWIGSGRITHLEEGDFAGNPAGLKWSSEPGSPLKLRADIFPDSVGLMYDFAQKVSSLKLPTVWLPHTIMGISTSAILLVDHNGFGPFQGQLLVGDQGHSKISRVYLEKVNGEYQGAAFPFREGFSSGILRMAWGNDQSLYVGMTSRGWSSTGEDMFGLERLISTGKTPFEIKTMQARSNGFELEFTEKVDPVSAADPKSYQMTGFTYSYHAAYGSPIIMQQNCPVQKAEVSDDRKRVRLYVSGLREGFIHEIKAEGVRSGSNASLLHTTGYYTLNQMPEGDGHEHEMIAAQPTENAAATVSCGNDPAKNPTAQPDDWDKPDVVITIGTKPGLKYDLETFEVEEGSKVKVIFNNDDDMLHNLVITEPKAGDEVGKMAMQLGLNGAQMGYVPASEKVLFHTCLLQPETSESIYFVAPKAGDYTYVCTFPGHYLNMRGTMKVTSRKTASR